MYIFVNLNEKKKKEGTKKQITKCGEKQFVFFKKIFQAKIIIK